MAIKSNNPPFLVDETTGAIVGVTSNAQYSSTPLVPFQIRSSAALLVTVPAATFVTPTVEDASGSVRLVSAGAHGLTAALAVGKSLYIAWSGGSGVSGFFSITAIDTDTTGVKITINLVNSATVTFPNQAIANTPTIVAWTSHGRSVGDKMQFTTTGALPTGIAASTDYFVRRVLSPNQFTISATAGGTEIITTAAGSGTHTATMQWGTPAVTVAGTQINLPTITVPAGVVSRLGRCELNMLVSCTNSANNKPLNILYNGSTTVYGSGNNTGVGSIQLNKILVPYTDGNIVTSAAAATGHGTSTNAVTAITASAYSLGFTLTMNTTLATANEFLGYYYYEVLCE